MTPEMLIISTKIRAYPLSNFVCSFMINISDIPSRFTSILLYKRLRLFLQFLIKRL